MRWKRKRLSRSSYFFAAEWTDATAKGIEQDNGRAVKNASIFNRNWLQKIWLRQHWIFSDFPYCCLLSWIEPQPPAPPSPPKCWQHEHPKLGVCRRTRSQEWDLQAFCRQGEWGRLVLSWLECHQTSKLYRWRRSEHGVWQFSPEQTYT